MAKYPHTARAFGRDFEGEAEYGTARAVVARFTAEPGKLLPNGQREVFVIRWTTSNSETALASHNFYKKADTEGRGLYTAQVEIAIAHRARERAPKGDTR